MGSPLLTALREAEILSLIEASGVPLCTSGRHVQSRKSAYVIICLVDFPGADHDAPGKAAQSTLLIL
jgi:hypothetical protein